MKKEHKSTISLEKYFPAIFHLIAFSENGVLSRKEIETMMINHNICGIRQVTNVLDIMVFKGHLVREKLKGQKRNGYAINEEIISKLNESYIISGVSKKGLPKYEKLTQRELNQEIKEVTKNYKKAIGNKKSEIHKDDVLFYVAHTTWITICLSWITRLTLSIDGGVFHDKINKISLARKNIELLENFIQLLCLKIREKNPEAYDLFLTSMHNYFEYLDPFENTPYSRITKEPSSLIR